MAGFLIYGANGFTGSLIAHEAVARGQRPVLAGRNAAAVAALARDVGLEYRAFALDDPGKVVEGIRGMQAVLHCAGPFAHTYRPMAEACLQAGVHYLDVTGEVAVFEGLAARAAADKAAGVMLLPGVGFDVVPSDCLAALKRRLPSATHLALGNLPAVLLYLLCQRPRRRADLSCVAWLASRRGPVRRAPRRSKSKNLLVIGILYVTLTRLVFSP
jgi:short subunit dehydrogenase-like uncharacterized protein